jgi:hypothetical protein
MRCAIPTLPSEKEQKPDVDSRNVEKKSVHVVWLAVVSIANVLFASA